ncbi:MAG: hypothetical protein KAS32_14885 [Candidatus Peribacteraceae bacterium]|nr:hypothetical protein [Candidatus Peribacteraceae bacterium]
MKLGDLKNVENIMVRLVNSELPIRTAFQLNIMVESLDKHLSRLEDFRIKLVKKYGTEDKEGNIQVNPESIVDFTNELKDLMDSDVEFTPTKIAVEVFEDNDIKLTVKDLNSLVKVGLVDNIE